MWTQFMDMHSGGGSKTQWEHIFIEAPTEEDARRIFVDRTGEDPKDVSCRCCGSNFSVTTAATLTEATAYERNCKYDNEAKAWLDEQDPRKTWESGKFIPLAEYEKRPDVLVIRAAPSESAT